MSSRANAFFAVSVPGDGDPPGESTGHIENPVPPPDPDRAIALEGDATQGDGRGGGDAAIVPGKPVTVWDLIHVQKTGTCKANGGWKCGWCNSTFKGWNATKVIFHLNKINKDIKPCPAKIDESNKALYKSIYLSKERTKVSTTKRTSQLVAAVNEGQQSLAIMFEKSRSRTTQGGGAGGRKSAAQRLLARDPSFADTTIEATTQSQLTTAIGDFVHSTGLSFRATSNVYFKNILKFARGVPASYVPPNHNVIATSLLELNYERLVKSSAARLVADAKTYGMALLGDGATVKKMALFNILASTPNEPAAVRDIIDCTPRMEAGEKKDAPYIASFFEESIEELDPEGDLVNVIIVDGASNVQKAGRILEAKYPQISVLHGVEHVVSLFFSDVARLAFFRFIIVNYRRVYRVFGSGAMHGPYAIFQKQAASFNGGRYIGLVRYAGTRMAGLVIALLRMCRLQFALLSTLASPEYKGLGLKKSVVKKAEAFLLTVDMWKALFSVVKSLFPALRLLRLADKCTPGMDQVVYFVRRTNASLEQSTRLFPTIPYFAVAIRGEEAMQDMLNDEELLEEDGEEEYETLLDGAYDHGSDHEEEAEDGSNSDDDSVLKLPSGIAGNELGSNIMQLWIKRRKHLISDYAIAGWLLSPLEDVRNDVQAKKNGVHMQAMDRILNKFYHRLTEDELGRVKDIFWTEFEQFHNKTGMGFGPGRKYIWNSELLRKKQSALWHAQYSLPFTEALGFIACRICSTGLGIGSCERAWGSLKHLKTDKRSHLGAKAVKMQSTIYSSACIERARILKKEKEERTELWNDNDLEFEVRLRDFNDGSQVPGSGVLPSVRTRRLFHAWLEPWEKVSARVQDPVHETKLLRKYERLKWLDPDSNTMYVAESGNLEWHRRFGWCVIGLCETGELEPWPIRMLPKLIKKTIQDPALNVEIIHLSTEEKARRKAARDLQQANVLKGTGKRKHSGDSSSDSSSDDDLH